MIKIAISELLCQCPMERKKRPWCSSVTGGLWLSWRDSVNSNYGWFEVNLSQPPPPLLKFKRCNSALERRAKRPRNRAYGANSWTTNLPSQKQSATEEDVIWTCGKQKYPHSLILCHHFFLPPTHLSSQVDLRLASRWDENRLAAANQVSLVPKSGRDS